MNARDLLEHLVRIPSPSGDERDAVTWMQEQASQDGLDVRRDRIGNLILEAGRGDLHVLFVGHIDTVPGSILVRRGDDALYGRGAVDAKGPLVAAYEAARRRRDDPDIRITLVGAVGEEADSRGARALDVDAPDLIINGEPSGWDAFTVGYKGLLRGGFWARGDPTHGGHPDPNALDRCTSWWASVRETLGHGTGFSDVQCRLDDLGTRHSLDADHVQGRFQLRLPPGTDPADAARKLEALAGAHAVTLSIDEAIPAAATGARSPLATAMRGAIRSVGGTPRALHKTGTADFNLLARRFPDVPMVAYGPGDSSLDHTPNEHILWDEFERGIEVLDGALGQVPALLHAGRAPTH